MGGDDKRTNYGLWCALCKLGFDCREEWYVHLVGNEHQVGSRMGMMGWGREERDQVLVAFCGEPVDKEGGKLVRWIAGRIWRVIVTDFVWWGERPRMAFVRFESRKVVELVLERCQGQPEGIQVHFQRASEFPELQWDAFLPEARHQQSFPKTPDDDEENASQALEDSDPQLSLQATSTSPLSSSTIFNDLSFQFEAITKPVRVPLVEWTFMQKLLKHLGRVGRTFDPPFQTRAFRHSYLKLRLPGYSTNWLIHVSSNGSPFPLENVEELLKRVSILSSARRLIDDNDLKKMGVEFHRREGSNNFNFTVVTFPMHIVEVQLSRLTEYLFSFDPRCIPLLGLVYYWYSTNDLRVCLEETSIKRFKSPRCVPGPATLEWMLISFLGGVAKVIPTARQVLERPHTPIYRLKDNHLDAGFDCDSDYCKEWRAGMENVPEEGTDEFYLSVVELAQQFFQYFGRLLKNERWILNTKDGEMLLTKTIVNNESKTLPRGIRLSAQEIEEIRIAGRQKTDRVHFDTISLYVTHPLYCVWQLGVQNEEVGKMQRFMKATGTRLKNWIDHQQGKRLAKGKQEDLATVLWMDKCQK